MKTIAIHWAVGDQARSGAIVWQQADTWAVDVDPGQQTIAGVMKEILESGELLLVDFITAEVDFAWMCHRWYGERRLALGSSQTEAGPPS